MPAKQSPRSNLCPAFLSSGTCLDKQCPLSHNVYSCRECALSFTSQSLYLAHLQNRRHQETVSQKPHLRLHFCRPCNKAMVSSSWNTHVQGHKHRQVCKRAAISNPLLVQPEEAENPPPHYHFCLNCNIVVANTSKAKHLQSDFHLARVRYNKHEVAMDEAQKDKNGIVVPSDGSVDFGIVAPGSSSPRQSLIVSASIPSQPVKFLRGVFQRANTQFSVEVSGGRVNEVVSTNNSLTISIDFNNTQNIGRYEDRIDLYFQYTQRNKQFIVSRTIVAVVGSKTDHDALRPKVSFVPRKRVKRDPEHQVEPGVMPPSLNAIPYKVFLPESPIPAQLINILTSDPNGREIRAEIESLIPSVWNETTYSMKVKYLIWLEEFQLERDLQGYDIPNAELRSRGVHHYLTVPGLAEKRPSVLVGDSILAQRHGAPSGTWFEGKVHIVRQEEVGLRFSPKFHSALGRVYNVRFKLNRFPVRRQLQALRTGFSEKRILFPDAAHFSQAPIVNPGTMASRVYNPLISTNPAQLQAVASIVALEAGSPPFVIFGPPGTGKTMTVVESINQVLRSNTKARIIACAPSNSAADIIALRLSQGAGALSETQLFRFYAPSRNKGDVPPQLEVYTLKNPDGHFTIPPLDIFKQFRVVVTTCVSASMFYGVGIPRGHYSHIFIDEAGQATEGECMNSIMTMVKSKETNVVLSGDPKQLGPIIRNRVAIDMGLAISYIERLMGMDDYDEVRGYGKSVVKLVKNFRSHEAILRFPNDRFYKGELEKCGNASDTDMYLRSSHLPAPNFPIVFYAVAGQDDREALSPSFFNIDEVTQVKSCIKKLREDKKRRISDDDIGVITPYHAQCLKIRASLKQFASGVKVGSVEEFQGQERKVIIISTVRSSSEFITFDLKHTLGFVANPRRFNVAVTRAQSLLMIVGDPNVLSLDPLWRSFLNYVWKNGGWKGLPIPWDPEEEVNENATYAERIRQNAEDEMANFVRTVMGEDEGGLE